VGLSEESRVDTRPATLEKSWPISEKLFMTCYNAWWIISLSASKSAPRWKVDIWCSLFSKVYVSYLIYVS
jgi:hypothetical protein